MRAIMKVELVKVVTCILLIRTVTTLIAYDCENDNVDLSTISIRDVAPCVEPDKEYVSEKLELIVLQQNEIQLQKVKTCLIEVTRLITHCGMHSHSSVVDGGLSNFVLQIGAEECNNLHRYQSVRVYGQEIGKIIMNGTTSASLTILGSVDESGSCEGATYHELGRTWKSVVITASVKIIARDYLAQVKLAENEISLLGGVTCNFLKGYCFDTTLGETVWTNYEHVACDQQLSIIYQGSATRVTQKSNGQTYIVVEQDDKIFAVSLIKRTWVCGRELWQTEHPRLLVSENTKEPLFKEAMKLLPQNTNLISYVNSKFLYIEQAYKREIETLYTDTVYRRCLVQREILRNRLIMAPFSPNVISQILQNEKGYIGRVLGEVLYIMKCIPTIVHIRRTESCYHELPVNHNNRSKFMSPITRILQSHAEEIECNSVTPPLYFLDNEWIGLTPYPTLKRAPRQLAVEETPNLKFSPIQPIGQHGLYTQDEVSKVQRILTFGTERKAVENIITRRVTGLDAESQGYSTLKIFDTKELKELGKSTIKQLYGWFTDVGVFMSGLIGVYVIFKAIKYCLGVILNGFHLYKIAGCGIYLIASLWNTLAVWIVQKKQFTRESRRRINQETQADEAELGKADESGPILQQPSTDVSRVYPTLPADQRHWTEPAHSGPAS